MGLLFLLPIDPVAPSIRSHYDQGGVEQTRGAGVLYCTGHGDRRIAEMDNFFFVQVLPGYFDLLPLTRILNSAKVNKYRLWSNLYGIHIIIQRII